MKTQNIISTTEEIIKQVIAEELKWLRDYQGRVYKGGLFYSQETYIEEMCKRLVPKIKEMLNK